VIPLTVSFALERGLCSGQTKLQTLLDKYLIEAYFANCPAIRAIRTTGLFAPVVGFSICEMKQRTPTYPKLGPNSFVAVV
jgi:hypothetical protein